MRKSYLVLKGTHEGKQRPANFDYNPNIYNKRGISSSLNTPFASWLYHFFDLSLEKKIFAEETLNAALKDQIVVDIGAGGYTQGYYVADRAGAKSYVAVELYFAHEAANSIAKIKKSGNDKDFDQFAVKHQINYSSCGSSR